MMIWKHKEKPQNPWKRYFAWKPTPIGTRPLQEGQEIVWLEWIERRWLDCRGSDRYEYRHIHVIELEKA